MDEWDEDQLHSKCIELDCPTAAAVIRQHKITGNMLLLVDLGSFHAKFDVPFIEALRIEAMKMQEVAKINARKKAELDAETRRIKAEEEAEMQQKKAESDAEARRIKAMKEAERERTIQANAKAKEMAAAERERNKPGEELDRFFKYHSMEVLLSML